MTEILTDYLRIYTCYPADVFLSKEKRKERHHALMEWTNKVYETMPNFQEIVAFMEKNERLKFEKPFVMKVLIPCVKADLEQGSFDSLKFLFNCNAKGENRINNWGRSYVEMFCEGTDFKYNSWQLADMILANEPDNQIVMYEKYIGLKHFLSYSIHEVPWGVLVGIGGAEKRDMTHMFQRLQEFTLLSKKLKKDDGVLIEGCNTFYQAWEKYLDCVSDYNGFEDYLIKQRYLIKVMEL